MNLGPFTYPTRAAAPAHRSRALVGTAALLFLAFGAAACGATGPKAATTPAAEAATTPDNAVTATGDPSAAGGGGSVPNASPVAVPAASARPAATSTQWPQLTWYTPQELGKKQSDPARIWRRTPAGDWQVVRTGNPGNGTVAGPIAVSPDGRRASWMESSARRLVISDFDGTKQTAVPTDGPLTCAPSWLDAERVLYGQGTENDWTLIAIDADGTGRKVLATHQTKCPTVSGGWVAQFDDRTVDIRTERATGRVIKPRIPSGLVIDRVAAVSADGRTLVLSTHVPNAGECGCGWRFRNYRVDAASGAATELAPLESAWTKPTGHGQAIAAVIAADGGLVVQVNAGTPADDRAKYRLVRHAADGRVLSNAAVTVDQGWGGLLG
ncbi:hypothetical protein [Micromonospora parathelypteridis]|uniref:WD40-like Beta Propeller Repeat n=1 Tax=Micromonospora parathelypteridis TaxID=1839617 RepID=A0A840W0I3_9ACTN|nr:hypothetical protein [Micromonospora parathelypteridis]MBB5478330.1 hypothetical protein [Micromonospora parathelypteridis]GGO06803.1 hypothetical protein GCM10011576_10810 [Micromonospora parathelypteridis]